jgi:dihydrofolate reductase
MLMGDANIAQQHINAELLGGIRIHLVHVVLGAGTSLFDNLGSQPIKLQRIEVIDAPEVTHLRFRVTLP